MIRLQTRSNPSEPITIRRGGIAMSKKKKVKVSDLKAFWKIPSNQEVEPETPDQHEVPSLLPQQIPDRDDAEYQDQVMGTAVETVEHLDQQGDLTEKHSVMQESNQECVQAHPEHETSTLVAVMDSPEEQPKNSPDQHNELIDMERKLCQQLDHKTIRSLRGCYVIAIPYNLSCGDSFEKCRQMHVLRPRTVKNHVFLDFATVEAPYGDCVYIRQLLTPGVSIYNTKLVRPIHRNLFDTLKAMINEVIQFSKGFYTPQVGLPFRLVLYDVSTGKGHPVQPHRIRELSNKFSDVTPLWIFESVNQRSQPPYIWVLSRSQVRKYFPAFMSLRRIPKPIANFYIGLDL